MKINWKVRFKNKIWVVGFLGTIVAFIYQILGMFDVVPSISKEQIIQLFGIIVNILVGFGVLIDPTTRGMSDSDRAMTYNRPR